TENNEQLEICHNHSSRIDAEHRGTSVRNILKTHHAGTSFVPLYAQTSRNRSEPGQRFPKSGVVASRSEFNHGAKK
ncbi:MAG: hypothetical protein ABGZ23_27910, partial [Fuerstiella sp.]